MKTYSINICDSKCAPQVHCILLMKNRRDEYLFYGKMEMLEVFSKISLSFYLVKKDA